ncbi:MAG: class I SAM-dependent methyltransferase [Chloroflexota bacterium]
MGFQHARGIRPRTLVARFLRRRQALLSTLLSDALHDATIVDVGCGSGETMARLDRRGRRVIGIDGSAPLLALARDAGASALVEADAHRLPLKHGAADAVIAMGLLDYVADPVKVLREMAAIAAPSGRVVFTYPLTPSPFGLLRRGLGARLRWALFRLPAIRNAATWRQLSTHMADAGLISGRCYTLWRASWLVEAYPSSRARAGLSDESAPGHPLPTE